MCLKGLKNKPMDTKKLRDKILQLAMKGKLVLQDPNDEPASILLEKIKEEKKKLIKDGRLKKGKPLSPITEEEIPYVLPNGWEWVRLGDIGDWGAGSTPSRSNSSYYNGDILWLKTGELNDGYIDDTEEKITKLAFQDNSLRLNRPGDVLIAMYGATIGKLGILNAEATTNQACCACTPFSQIFNMYLFYLLLSMREEFRKQGAGGAQPNISKQKIMNTIVPLPPFNEQKHIVEKVGETFALVEELANNRDGLLETINITRDEILKEAVQGELVLQDPNNEPASLLLDKIKEEKEELIKEGKLKKEKPLAPITEEEIPYLLPRGWEWVRLGVVTAILRGSSPRPKGDKRYFSEAKTSYNWITISDITNFSKGNILYKTREYLTIEGSLKSTYVDKNEIIIAVSGSTTGKSCITGINGYVYDGLGVIRLFSKEIHEKYLLLFIKQLYNFINNSKEGSAFPNINTDKLKKLVFPLPPLNEQLRIIEKVSQLMSLCDELEENIEQFKGNEFFIQSVLQETSKDNGDENSELSFGEFIKQKRRDKGITVTDMLKFLVDVKSSEYTKIEEGLVKPEKVIVEKIAEVLKLSELEVKSFKKLKIKANIAEYSGPDHELQIAARRVNKN